MVVSLGGCSDTTGEIGQGGMGGAARMGGAAGMGGVGGQGGGGSDPIAALCEEICAWPEERAIALGAPSGPTYLTDCAQSVEEAGFACLDAAADLVSCLGSCDPNELTIDDIVRCADEGQRVDQECP